jgi:DNA repair protein RadD
MTELLRPYQSDVVGKFERTVAAGQKRIILTAPTGSGKTEIAAEIIKRAVAHHQTVLVLAHRREIIGQTSRKLYAHGIRHGIIQSGLEKLLRPFEAVQIASIQTLHARAVRSNAMPLPPANLLIIDESHHCPANTYSKIIESYPDAVLLGLTATPCRGDGRGLGGIFSTMIECPQVATLIEQGYLVKTRIYAPVDPDLRGVHTVAGDYVENQLADRMDRAKLIGDIVTHWFKYGERRKTVVFACSVGHGVHIRDEFIRAGVRAEHLDGSTPKADRDAILARLASGDTELVANCLVLTEGFDLPDLGCCILARPTKKMGLYRQMLGRVLRPADGKPDAIVLDHSGAVFRHGLPEDHVEWSLDPDLRATAPAHQKRQSASEAKLVECTKCSALRDDAKSMFPVMLAVVRDISGKPVSLHRTYLTENGSGKAPVEKPRKIVSKHGKGPHVRLTPIAATLGIAEGIETALAASRLFGIPTWSVLSTYGIETFEPPAELERLIIFADNDVNGAGQKAAYALAARLSGHIALEVKIPDKPGTDWNDVLRQS